MGLSLLARRDPLAAASEQLRLLAQTTACQPFETALNAVELYPLHATGITTLQLNLGKLCNQTCRHCHVDAGPDRTEVMSKETLDLCLQALARTDIPTVDITGGAPELNPHFRWVVEQARLLGRQVLDRCNLSVLLLPSQADLGEFLAQHRVEVIASLPSYQATQTDAQRGEGIFDKSMEALRLLNRLGYGKEGSGLTLNLVYNPVGAFLPPKQEGIEAKFRKELASRHGVSFTRLYTITNMPISRFLEFLIESGNYEGYMERLAAAFNPAAAAGRHVPLHPVCRMGRDPLRLRLQSDAGIAGLGRELPRHIRDFDPAHLHHRQIVTRNHLLRVHSRLRFLLRRRRHLARP
jgi:radical SAM/Cys-rich protein